MSQRSDQGQVWLSKNIEKKDPSPRPILLPCPERLTKGKLGCSGRSDQGQVGLSKKLLRKRTRLRDPSFCLVLNVRTRGKLGLPKKFEKKDPSPRPILLPSPNVPTRGNLSFQKNIKKKVGSPRPILYPCPNVPSKGKLQKNIEKKIQSCKVDQPRDAVDRSEPTSHRNSPSLAAQPRGGAFPPRSTSVHLEKKDPSPIPILLPWPNVPTRGHSDHGSRAIVPSISNCLVAWPL